jgi:16S rRNA (adenine1518-N6/adenine1519-N6)-dimethyltransferase
MAVEVTQPRYGTLAKKRFGQHFLHDANVIARIIAAIAPQRTDSMIEIGPGPGAMTFPLSACLDHLHVIDIDRDVIAHLRAALPVERVTIHEADFLRFDLAPFGPDLRIVGNLPYNISTPILFRISEIAEHVRDCVFMLQKEVVDRMVASPDTPEYGRLSVMLQYRFLMKKLFHVGPGAFKPPPKVDSAIVRLQPLGPHRLLARNENDFSAIVAAGFNQRRKTLANALRAWLAADTIRAAEIDPMRRAETLSVEEFVRLADARIDNPRLE